MPQAREAPAAGRSAEAEFVVPALTGRVVDQAALLDSATRVRLTEQLAALERATGHQLVVVTLSSLQNRSIEDVGLRLGNGWKIGRKTANDGVLLIVAPNERQVRIEVGRGLERAVTDAEAAAIIDQAILPAFREADMAGGIQAGVDRILGEIGPETKS